MVHISILGGGPGNLDLAKFADQVPAKPPAGMSAALTVSDTATREKAKINSLVFMADMIIRIEAVSTLFRLERGARSDDGSSRSGRVNRRNRAWKTSPRKVNLVRVPRSRRETLQSTSGSLPCLPGYCDAS